MKPLGKPLLFCLKYMTEMKHLCDPDEHGGDLDLTGLDDAEQVREMARTVGEVASEQAAEFLELCGKRIEAHFTGLGIAKLTNKANRATVRSKRYWYRNVHCSPSSNGWFSCGVGVSGPSGVRITVEKNDYGFVLPFLRFKGARNRADAIRGILGVAPDTRAGVRLVEDSDTFVLACIPITAQPPETFDADRDQLIVKVMEAIARMGAEQTRAIANLAAGLAGPNETAL
jgi:hypothetical protein